MDDFKHEVNGESSRVRLSFIDPNDMEKGIRAEFDPHVPIRGADVISYPAAIELTWKDLNHWFWQYTTLQKMKEVFSQTGFVVVGPVITPDKE